MADKVSFLEAWAPTGRTNKEGKEEPWARVGVAFPLKSGEGFTIKLNALPINGTIIVKPPKPKEGGGESPF